VVVQELLVDGFAPAKAVRDLVPEMDAVLAALPAQVDLTAPEQRGKVD
jgi:hypothetical protein